jgi:hypothetical protein
MILTDNNGLLFLIMDNIFVKKFKENRQWQDFSGVYLNNPPIKPGYARSPKTAVADEDLWPFIIASLGGFLACLCLLSLQHMTGPLSY